MLVQSFDFDFNFDHLNMSHYTIMELTFHHYNFISFKIMF